MATTKLDIPLAEIIMISKVQFSGGQELIFPSMLGVPVVAANHLQGFMARLALKQMHWGRFLI